MTCAETILCWLHPVFNYSMARGRFVVLPLKWPEKMPAFFLSILKGSFRKDPLCAEACLWRSEGLLGCKSCLFTLLETGCLFCWSVLCMLPGWLTRVPCVSGDLPVSTLHLCVRVLESRMCSAVPSFYIGLRDLNSHPCSCMESTLAIKQPLQLDFF